MNTRITYADGLVINGEYSGNSHQDLIILCHGYKSSGFTPVMKKLSAGLNERGYATFAFDFPPDAEVDIQRQVAVLNQIVKHFPKQQAKILMGASLGVIAATIAAIEDPAVTALITVNGFFGERGIGPEFRRNFRKFRLLSFLIPKIHKIWKYFKAHLAAERLKLPVLVIHSKTDTVVPILQSENFYAKIKAPKKLVKLDNVAHGLKGENDVVVVISAVEVWLKSVEGRPLDK